MKIFIITLTLFLSSCSGLKVEDLQKVLETGKAPLTSSQMAQGLRDTLEHGTIDAVLKTSKVDGFLNNSKIRIPFPQKAQKIKDTLTKIGLKSLVNKFEVSLNRAAENAVTLAKPIFIDTISSLSISDALNIIKGSDNAATNYLRSKTYSKLLSAFKPSVERSLSKTSATRYWGDMVSRYNQIPFIKKLDPSLANYATSKTLDGLFYELSLQEKLIRKDPVKRVTELMKRIFTEIRKS